VDSGAGSGLTWSWRAVWNWVSLGVGMGVLLLSVSGDLSGTVVCWVEACVKQALPLERGVELVEAGLHRRIALSRALCRPQQWVYSFLVENQQKPTHTP